MINYKKSLTWFILFFINLCSLHAYELMINFDNDRSISELRQNSFENTSFLFSFEGLNFLTVKTEHGTFTELIMPGGHSIGALGTPKLPASNKLIEVPFGAEVSIRVLNYTTEYYRLSDFGVEHPLVPVQPSLRKDQDISEVPFKYKPDIYSKRSYIEPEIATVEVLGVMRGQRLGRVTISPVHYNPANNSIRVYNNIEVEIEYTGADEALTREIKASTFSPWFDVVYDQVINRFDTRDVFDDHPDLLKYPVKMVIVSHDDFQETLQPFIEWKTKQGFEIIEAYTSEIGSSASAIQSFIHDKYNAGTPQDPAPTFVIVAGDPTKLPASAIGSASSQVTDLYYASVDGDYFPDMYIGRLSARNVQELQNQLDKILYYQQYEFTDPSYLNDVTLIAGHDNYWNPQIGQPTVHYATQNYFNAAQGFANVNAYLNSYSGVYDEARIAVSMINYTAHCSSTRWANPHLSASDIHNMTNSGSYPLAIGNCCESAQFSHAESIGEAWMRAENKGAVAYIGSAPNTHWFEDFYWAVGAFPISGNNNGYVPSVDETTPGAYDAHFISDYVAVASIKFVGNLAITEAHLQNYPTHSNVQWYWEGYHTFGDPSTVVYLTEGSENVVSHMPILPIGLDTYTVEALPGSYVGISMNGLLHGAAFVDETGAVDVPIDPILDGGDVTIVVTKPQHIPYIAEVPAAQETVSSNIMKIFDVSAIAGQTATIELEIINDDAFAGFNLDIPLPSGFSHVPGTAQLYRDDGHFFEFAIVQDNIARMISAAIPTKPFLGNNGVIVSFDVQTPEIAGAYTLDIIEAVIADANGINIMTDAIPGTVTIESLQDNLYLQDIFVSDGMEDCHSALNSIITAGENTDFIVYEGGSATLIAGKSIHLLPGTTVEHGGYLLARIASHANDYCDDQKAIAFTEEPIAMEEDGLSAGLLNEVRKNGFFKLYPNPTEGNFTLELTTVGLEQGIKAEVLSMLGDRIFSKELPPQRLHALSLEGHPPGIYIIRVMKGDQLGVERLIKR